MRIKTDFVTNSSSSSFLVVFKTFPTSAKSLREQVFGERKEFDNPYPYHMDFWSTKEVAEYIFNRTRPASKEDIKYFWEYYDEDYPHKEPYEFEGKPCAIYNFSDNDGELETALEHGNVFRNLESYRDSQH